MNFLRLMKSLFTSAPQATPAECVARVRAGTAKLIDVRESREWTDGVARTAVLLPLSDLTGSRTQWSKFLQANAGSELLLYCAAGGRSGIAARILISEGHRATNVGSLAEWSAAGWPIEKPPAGRS
jgi:rhodanese-related sulfurtransferase